MAAEELGVILEYERLVVLAGGDHLLQAGGLAGPLAQAVAVQPAARENLPVHRPEVFFCDEPAQRVQLRQRVRGAILADELQELLALDLQFLHRGAGRALLGRQLQHLARVIWRMLVLRRRHQPRIVTVGVRPAPPHGAWHVRLLLCDTDEQHSLVAGEAPQIVLCPVVLTLTALELDQINPFTLDEAFDGSHEVARPGRQQRRLRAAAGTATGVPLTPSATHACRSEAQPR